MGSFKEDVVCYKIEQWKKGPGCLGNIGDEMLPSYVGMIQRKHEIRIPEVSNQDSMASKTGFFVAQIVVQLSFKKWMITVIKAMNIY